MCDGTYDVLDARCVNWSYKGRKCYWCKVTLNLGTWFKHEEMLKHEEHCEMFKQAKILEESENND